MGIKKHLPLFFDICVIAFIVLLPMQRGGVAQRIFLVHGAFVLTLLGLICPKQRTYRSWPLFILAIWAGVNMFWRSYSGLQNEEGEMIAFFTQQVNWALLHEGFLYILCAILLIWSIVEHAKSWKLYFLPILYWVVYWVGAKGFNMMGLEKVVKTATKNYSDPVGWSMTILLALIGAGFITLVRMRKWKIVIPIGLLGLSTIIFKWQHLWVKIQSRPDFWIATIKRIINSKGLGWGFYHTISTANGLVAPELPEFKTIAETGWGRGWRQCDFLELGEYLGIIAFICVVWFVIETLWKAPTGLAFFLGVTALLACIVQRTMFFPIQAGLIQIIITLVILEKRSGNKDLYRVQERFTSEGLPFKFEV